MRVGTTLGSLAIICVAAGMGAPAAAQTFYKCGARVYSQVPCSKHVVNTDDAPVPQHPAPRVVAVRRLPGETDEQLALRRRRDRLAPTDRDECARLDTKIPFEQERAKSTDAAEAGVGEAELGKARGRARALGC